METVHVLPIDTSFGRFALAWGNGRVSRIYLPGEKIGPPPGGEPDDMPPGWVRELAVSLRRCMDGEEICFPLDRLDLDRRSPFQRRVLLAEHAVPRGWVSTYGRIARRVGRDAAARAVGRALATNPWPVVIPCHRAVRSDGSLGGYRGGAALKRRLLEMEGVAFTPDGRVSTKRVFY